MKAYNITKKQLYGDNRPTTNLNQIVVKRLSQSIGNFCLNHKLSHLITISFKILILASYAHIIHFSYEFCRQRYNKNSKSPNDNEKIYYNKICIILELSYSFFGGFLIIV